MNSWLLEFTETLEIQVLSKFPITSGIALFADFQNTVILQRVDGLLFPTPEMKARDAYVPFLLSKPLNKNEISELN